MTRRLVIRDDEEVEHEEGYLPAALLRAFAAVAGRDGDVLISEYAFFSSSQCDGEGSVR